MADEFIFFGTKSEEIDMGKKKESQEAQSQRNSAAQEAPPKEVLRISAKDNSKIDDDTLRMLRRTRHSHDPQTVYMQSDISFYDTFYTSDDDMLIDDKELLDAARSIRRVYKSYPEYLCALHIRELYMDALMEKIDNDLMFSAMIQAGDAKVWTPPNPIYSKRSPDYEDGSNGIINLGCLVEWNDDRILELLTELKEEQGIPEGEDISVVFDVATDNLTIAHSELVGEAVDDRRSSSSTSVNLSDMNELQKIFRGWYQDDTPTANESDLESRAFSKTPERIRHDYYMSQILDMSKEFRNAMDGIPNKPEYNPTEMVYDDKTGKPMSRLEYDKRILIRQLEGVGWTNSLKLMKLMNVGSSREYTMMQRKKKRNKKRKNKVATSYSDDDNIYGSSVDESMVFSDLDSLKAHMFPD